MRQEDQEKDINLKYVVILTSGTVIKCESIRNNTYSRDLINGRIIDNNDGNGILFKKMTVTDKFVTSIGELVYQEPELREFEQLNS